ncbi:MAG: NADPH:quinone oxidoreductase family protein [Minwuiales bacterium]|nr:NADPH:quinone oxidoreductase family protein [Minwuiales bacterium]
MRCVLCEDWCDYDDLMVTETDPPPMRPGGVRIRIRFAGVSFATTLVVSGRYQRKPPLPFVPGTEVAGEVIECADGVNRCKPGDRVFAMIDWGGYAEQVVAAQENVHVLPDGLDLEAAVALPSSYGTSYGALVWRAKLTRGERLLVHGAAGGVGLAAVEIGKALGATVYAVAGGSDKVAALRDRSADAVIDGRAEDFRTRVKELTDGEGVDVVFDPVGGEVFDNSLRCLADDGRLLTIGYTSGAIPTIPANQLLLKNVAVMGFNWGQYVGWGLKDERRRYADRTAAAMAALVAWWQAGKLHPTIHARFPLEDFRTAMAEVRNRRAIGRVVLAV